MKHYICPYCGYELHGYFKDFCPECFAVLSLEPYNMQKERINLLLHEAQTAVIQNRWQLAQHDLIEVLTLEPRNNEARLLLKETKRSEKLAKYYIQAQIHCYNKRWNKALEYYEKIMAVQPEYRDVNTLILTAKRLQQEDKRVHSKLFQRSMLRWILIAGVILADIMLMIAVIWFYASTIRTIAP